MIVFYEYIGIVFWKCLVVAVCSKYIVDIYIIFSCQIYACNKDEIAYIDLIQIGYFDQCGLIGEPLAAFVVGIGGCGYSDRSCHGTLFVSV